MKILVLTHKPPYPPNDGGTIATSVLIDGLLENGNQIDIKSMCTPKHSSSYCPLNQDLTIQYEYVDTQIKPLQFLWNLMFSKLPYQLSRFYSYAFLNLLIKKLEHTQYDVIQLESFYLVPYIVHIRKKTNTPIALRAHNIENEIWIRTAEREKNIFKRLIFRHIANTLRNYEISNINKYDFLINISIKDQLFFNEHGNTKPNIVIPSGIKSNLQTFKTTNQSMYLVYIGALDWLPNQEGIIWFLDKVWKSLYLAYPTSKLLIAGRNAPLWLKKQLDFTPGVDFQGEVESSMHFLAQAQIMVVPLFSGSGMRVKIIEGMAHGKTIVTTPIGAEGIDVVHGENILIANNEDDFKELIDELWQNNEQAENIAINAKHFVEQHYNYILLAKKLMEFYQAHI